MSGPIARLISTDCGGRCQQNRPRLEGDQSSSRPFKAGRYRSTLTRCFTLQGLPPSARRCTGSRHDVAEKRSVLASWASDACSIEHNPSLLAAQTGTIVKDRCVLTPSIVGVGFQDPTQRHLAQDNDAVHTITPDRSSRSAKPFCQGKPAIQLENQRSRFVSRTRPCSLRLRTFN